MISFQIREGLDTAGTCGAVKLLDDAAKARLQVAFLRRSDLGRNDEIGQALQGVADGVQPLLAVEEGRRGGGAGVGVGSQKVQRRPKQSAPVLRVGHAVGRHQGKRVVRFQSVALDAVQHGILILGGQRAQGMSHRGAERALREGGLRRTREACRDIQTAGDPLGLFVQ